MGTVPICSCFSSTQKARACAPKSAAVAAKAIEVKIMSQILRAGENSPAHESANPPYRTGQLAWAKDPQFGWQRVQVRGCNEQGEFRVENGNGGSFYTSWLNMRRRYKV